METIMAKVVHEVCLKCGDEKALSDFGLKTRLRGNEQYWCLVCREKYPKQYIRGTVDRFTKKDVVDWT